jgi:hypothetical protein
MSLDTTNWVKYPFSVDGVDFVSLLDPNGSFAPQVAKLPEDVFADENAQMVAELIGNPAKFTRNELEAELARINDGATQALLALA